MDQIHQTRKRIAQRMSGQKSETEKPTPAFQFVYSLTILALLAGCGAVAWHINLKAQFVPQEKIMEITGQLKERAMMISAWFPFEQWFVQEQKVSAQVDYEPVQDHYYRSLTGNEVHSISDGIILYVSQQESGQLVMVRQDDGILATYGALQQAEVHVNDRIMKGGRIGSVEDVVYLEFSYQGTELSLEEALTFEK